MICRGNGNANERTGQRLISAWNWKREEQVNLQENIRRQLRKKTSEQDVRLLELWNQIWLKGVSCIWQNM